MKKKIFTCVIIALVIIGSIISCAISANIEELSIEKNAELNEQIAEDSMEILKSADVEKIIKILRKQGLEDDDIQRGIDEYVALITIYQPTKSEIKIIESMVKDGKDLLKICKLYTFLYNTVEGTAILEEVYEFGENINFSGAYWIETAYNAATEYKHGTLSMAEIIGYVDKGITTDEIRVANTLSRMSDTTIQNILDEKVNGMTWSEVFENNLSDYNREHTNTTASALLDEAIMNKKSKNELITKDEMKRREKEAKAYAKAVGKNLKKKEQLTEKIYNEVASDEITIEDVSKWQKQGFTSGEIKKASKIAKEQDVSIDIVLEKYRARNVWIGE